MLENGFGEHNIQGIGDKHIPLIHNVMNTDVVVGGQRPGHRRARRAVQHRPPVAATSPTARACRVGCVDALAHFGLVVDLQRAGRDQDRQAARPRARRRDRSPWPPTAAAMYPSERAKTLLRALRRRVHRPRRRRGVGPSTSPTSTTGHVIECTERDRNRIFNLGYYTWVEQQGTPFELFEARRLAGVLARAAPLPAGVGRDDRRVQRPRRGLTVRAIGSAGWSCAVCGTHVDIAAPLVWRCPRATDADPPSRAAPRSTASRPLRGDGRRQPVRRLPAVPRRGTVRRGQRHDRGARTAMTRQLDADVAGSPDRLHSTPFVGPTR